MTDEQGHNGWKNYETWAMALHIDNEPDTYDTSRSIVADEIEYSRENQEDGDTFTLAENTTANVARALKVWREEAYEDAVQTLNDGPYAFCSDLLGAAWSVIDWYEIAAAYLSEVDA